MNAHMILFNLLNGIYPTEKPSVQVYERQALGQITDAIRVITQEDLCPKHEIPFVRHKLAGGRILLLCPACKAMQQPPKSVIRENARKREASTPAYSRPEWLDQVLQQIQQHQASSIPQRAKVISPITPLPATPRQTDEYQLPLEDLDKTEQLPAINRLLIACQHH